MRRLALIVSVAALAGCEMFTAPTADVTFVNYSDHTIEVEPNGQDWIGFSLAPDESRGVSVSDVDVYFTYNESDWYYMQRQPAPLNSVEFWNEPLTTWSFNNQSSLDITIGPQTGTNAQDWQAFTALSGFTTSIEIPYSTIYLTYSDSGSVDMNYISGEWVITNR